MADAPQPANTGATTWEARAFERFMEGGRTRPALLACRLVTPSGPELRQRAVVKAVGHPEITTRHLCLEYVGATLAPAFHCAAPEPMVVSLTPEFVAATAESYARSGISVTAGLAFGSAFKENILPVFPNARYQRQHILAAAQTYAFDMAIQNVDRRREKPNCAIASESDGLLLFDFEKAFAFLVPDLGLGPKPWEVSRFGFCKDHAFYGWLKSEPINWEWVPAALRAAVAAAEQCSQHLPPEWRDGLSQIVAHLEVVCTKDGPFVDELKASLR